MAPAISPQFTGPPFIALRISTVSAITASTASIAEAFTVYSCMWSGGSASPLSKRNVV